MAAPRIFDVYLGSGCTYKCKFCVTSTFWERDFRSKSPQAALDGIAVPPRQLRHFPIQLPSRQLCQQTRVSGRVHHLLRGAQSRLSMGLRGSPGQR